MFIVMIFALRAKIITCACRVWEEGMRKVVLVVKRRYLGLVFGWVWAEVGGS